MNIKDLIEQIKSKKSFLCVGLDTDINRLPAHMKKRPESIVTFNRSIIEATSDLAVAYKINTAFYEQYGSFGWDVMSETLRHIPTDCYTIADAKRGDIGNTSAMYARAFFENLSFDSITVNPYMGEDSVRPFLEYGKGVIVLALTSNEGSKDFQYLESEGKPLYRQILERVSSWAGSDQLMFVVGATRADRLKEIRQYVPDHFLLVPGVGAQGGSLKDVAQNGLNSVCGLLVNASRSIIYATDGENFATAARNEALNLQKEMASYLP